MFLSNRFKLRWLKNPKIQRAALLFGTYSKVTPERKMKSKLPIQACMLKTSLSQWRFPTRRSDGGACIRTLGVPTGRPSTWSQNFKIGAKNDEKKAKDSGFDG